MAQVKFCTSFDHHYLDRGLVLYESLREHYPGAILQVLALTKECEDFLNHLNLNGVEVLPLSMLLENYPELIKARSTRNATEFIFTLTPFIVCETLKSVGENDQVIYLDADMMFFGSPAAILETSVNYDVAITPHRFSRHMEGQKRFGIYNVGWVGFKKSAGGIRCANWWAERCLEWCHDRLENGKFADQKYLETFKDLADSVYEIDHIGVNCAPWNASFHRFTRQVGKAFVDNTPLVLYHFAKVKRILPWCIATRAKQQAIMRAPGIAKNVYSEYAKQLEYITLKYHIPQNWFMAKKNLRHGAKYRNFQKDENPSNFQIFFRILTREYAISSMGSLSKLFSTGHSDSNAEDHPDV
jgi:lipopolysaccharide biosynthesis glycosyltransferase